jgi:cyanophycinase
MTFTNQSLIGATDPLSLHNLRLHVLSHGDRYNFRTNKSVPQNRMLPPTFA